MLNIPSNSTTVGTSLKSSRSSCSGSWESGAIWSWCWSRSWNLGKVSSHYKWVQKVQESGHIIWNWTLEIYKCNTSVHEILVLLFNYHNVTCRSSLLGLVSYYQADLKDKASLFSPEHPFLKDICLTWVIDHITDFNIIRWGGNMKHRNTNNHTVMVYQNTLIQ